MTFPDIYNPDQPKPKQIRVGEEFPLYVPGISDKNPIYGANYSTPYILVVGNYQIPIDASWLDARNLTLGTALNPRYPQMGYNLDSRDNYPFSRLEKLTDKFRQITTSLGSINMLFLRIIDTLQTPLLRDVRPYLENLGFLAQVYGESFISHRLQRKRLTVEHELFLPTSFGEIGQISKAEIELLFGRNIIGQRFLKTNHGFYLTERNSASALSETTGKFIIEPNPSQI